MTLKKKLAVSTLAVSMAAASVAGLPLGSKSIIGKSGIVGTASAAADLATVKQKVDALYAALGTDGRAALRATRDEVNSKIDQAKFDTIFAPVLSKLATDVDRTELYNLFHAVANVYYSVDYSSVEAIRNNQTYIDLLKGLAVDAGVADLTVEDVITFVFGVEDSLRTLVSSKTTSELVTIATNASAQQDLIDDAIEIVLGKTAGTNAYTVSTVLNNLHIDTASVKQALNALRAELTTDKASASALALAYIKAFGLGYTPDPGSVPSTPGTTTTTTTPTTVKADGIYDVSKLVTIVGDKATLKLVDADVLKAFDALVAASTVKTGLTLTLDLGTVNAATVDVSLSKAIIEAAKAKGIANVAVKFNGLTVTIPVEQFNEVITLTTSKLPEATVTSITYQPLASGVYDFSLTVGGVPTTSFQKPILVSIPLVSTSFDQELLTLAKIINSKLEYHGGRVIGNNLIEARNSFSTYAVIENKVSFNDIANVQAWAGRQIAVVAAKGAIEGVGNGNFAPKSNVTRAEFSKMLIRALDLENNFAKQSFSDVDSTSWYAPYVAVAAEKGIVTGRSATKFDPNATITRAEMATMIARAVKAENPDAATNATALSQFSDAAKISATLRDGVAFAASNSLVIGNDGKFNPNNTATRAEAAVIIYRTINFK
ncbi:S-layer homology domain-containing protein [Paenibacillus sp. MMS20-IR301]|uniref:S-layer homology domain-containing protein n=1 Tax=Paenibacillus sp. MMS20-IR301 TaxID=2895946 RepID=UPI0028EE42EA|nr:S-layer homology domain-containing protein [Paenibacillus sp. MMS20-IR301]WNS43517.1 S-layer homology domain-containing protein [Paenibacillus sp. MMS20-IR301]